MGSSSHHNRIEAADPDAVLSINEVLPPDEIAHLLTDLIARQVKSSSQTQLTLYLEDATQQVAPQIRLFIDTSKKMLTITPSLERVSENIRMAVKTVITDLHYSENKAQLHTNPAALHSQQRPTQEAPSSPTPGVRKSR